MKHNNMICIKLHMKFLKKPKNLRFFRAIFQPSMHDVSPARLDNSASAKSQDL